MASLPQVGLEATIAGMGAFQSAANSIQSTYNQLDKAASNVAKSTTSSFVSLGNGVIGFAQTAATVGVAGIAALTAGFVGLGVMAVGEFSKYERMSLSITNLVAREISQGQLQEQQIQTRISLTKKENEELSALPQKIKDEELSRNTLSAQIQEQRQRIIDLTASYGDNGLNVQTAKNRLAEMENEYSKSGQEIDKLNGRITELNNKNGQLSTTLQKVRTGQMSMTDAMAQAGPRAAELLKWIQILAIQSPFTQEGVANAFRTALAYGFTTEQAQRITSAMIDFTSATGKSEESANLIALALGQIQARGKLSAQELRQLSEQGVGVNKILEDMGFSLDDVTNGLVPVDKFIEATIKDMEVFKGAAKAQSTTFAGLIASMSDLKSIGLREFFTGTFNAIQPYAASFVEWLTNAALQTGSIKKVGESLGQYVGGALKTVADLVAQFQRWGPEGIFAAMGFKSSSLFIAQIKSLWDLITSQGPSAQSIFEGIGGVIEYLQQNAFPLLTKAVSFVMNNFESFKGALMGIGAVLATGVFAAIVAGLLTLLTPINLIIAAAATLGAAWAGNWLGIRDTLTSVWQSIQPIFNNIKNLFDTFQAGGLFGNSSQQAGGLLQALGLTPDSIKFVKGILDSIKGVWLEFQTNGLWGNTSGGQQGGLLAMIGLSDQSIAILQDAFNQITTSVTNFVTQFNTSMGGITQADIINTLAVSFSFVAATIINTLNVVIPVIAQFVTWLQTNIPQAVAFLVQTWQTNWLIVAATIMTAWTVIQAVANGLITALTPAFQQIQAAIIPVEQAFAGLGISWSDVGNALITATGIVAAAIGAALLGIVSVIAGVVVGVVSGLTSIANSFTMLNQFATNALGGIIIFIQGWVTSISALLSGDFITAWEGFKQELLGVEIFVGNTMMAIATLFIAPFRAILSALGGFVTSVVGFWQGLFDTLVGHSIIPDMMDAIVKVFQGVNWFDLGASMITGILEGIEKNKAKVWEVLKTMAKKAIEEAGKAIGFGSPATEFIPLGESIMQGLMVGVDTGSKDFNRKLSGVMQSAINLSGEMVLQGVSGSTRQIVRNIFNTFVRDHKGELATLTGEQLKNYIIQYANQFGGNATFILQKMEEEGYNLNQMADAMKNSFSGLSKTMRLEGLSQSFGVANQFVSLGQTAANRMKDAIDARVKELQGYLEMANSPEWWRLNVQEELNQKLAEQAKIQKQINDLQEQQSTLQFLQQQVDLLKMVQERGLDASQIFQGITFGVNASLPDLIKATSNVVQAMIGQINADLQIASPSKVMARIGTFMNKGLAQGILDTMNIPVQALNNVINIPIGQAGGGSSSVTNETNYNFSMSVNSGASPQGVIQQFQVMRAMLS